MHMWNTLLLTGLAVSPWVFADSTKTQLACTADAIPRPDVFGAEILDVKVSENRNLSILAEDGPFPANLTVSYCGVNISYTHPGWNDKINVEIWLPLDNWNRRFQGTGGGGYQTGDGASALVPAVSNGYSAASTDGGHPSETADAASPSGWALLSQGNLNWPLLQDFAAVALADMTTLGQEITAAFYGEKPAFSYWTGCSTGGRQGLMMAQRYPELYDGIVALAPAINWDTFLVAEYWPQQIMNQLGVYPPSCELEAFTKAAIDACDTLDGLEDGIISDADRCVFNPYSMVGQHFDCDGLGNQTFSSQGAAVVDAAWTGLIDPSGAQQWYGLGKDAALLGIAGTMAVTDNSTTKGAPFRHSADWIKWFVAKDADFALDNMTNEEYFRILRQSRNQFASIMGTSDPDLNAFKARNGKLITWHGLADPVIFPNGTVDYYRKVMAEVPDVQDFYRIFQAPGVAHCSGGAGPQPVDELKALVDWVERGIAPETLSALNVTLNGQEPGPGQSLPQRKICAWPKKQVYNGGDPLVAESFDCA